MTQGGNFGKVLLRFEDVQNLKMLLLRVRRISYYSQKNFKRYDTLDLIVTTPSFSAEEQNIHNHLIFTILAHILPLQKLWHGVKISGPNFFSIRGRKHQVL